MNPYNSMFTKSISLFLVSAMLLGSCAPSIKRIGYKQNPAVSVSPDCKVPVFENLTVDPAKAAVLGTIKIGDNGLSTNCGKPQVMEIIRREACALHADAINLRDIREPSALGSTCYRVTADFLKYTEDGFKPETQQSMTAGDAVTDQKEPNPALMVLGAVVGFAIGFAITSTLFK